MQRCEREGSLDANIVQQSEQANDLELYLRKYKTISAIFFNGKAAHTIFKRHFCVSNFMHIKCYVLPSTSPAHASMTREKKLQYWQVIADHLKIGNDEKS